MTPVVGRGLEHRKLDQWQCQIPATRGRPTSRSPPTCARPSRRAACSQATGCPPNGNTPPATASRSAPTGRPSPCPRGRIPRDLQAARQCRPGPPVQPRSPEYTELSARLDRVEETVAELARLVRVRAPGEDTSQSRPRRPNRPRSSRRSSPAPSASWWPGATTGNPHGRSSLARSNPARARPTRRSERSRRKQACGSGPAASSASGSTSYWLDHGVHGCPANPGGYLCLQRLRRKQQATRFSSMSRWNRLSRRRFSPVISWASAFTPAMPCAAMKWAGSLAAVALL